MAKKKTALIIKSLSPRSFLFHSGLRPRDRIVSINGCDIADELDFYYHAAQDFFEIEIERGGRIGTVEVERAAGVPLEIEFYESAVGRCANKCIFCFVDQQPKGLRRSLYIKDEDLKHSFLNGNYMTLTSMLPDELNRIVSLGLSPLFVSVHATDRDIRAMMLGNKRIPDVRRQLSYLSAGGIAFHTQIVLCPKINDGAVLERTVEELFGYGDALMSIAVVPVGLTRFRKNPLAFVDKDYAVAVCTEMGAVSEQMKLKDKVRKLFLADEFFIKAKMPIPPASYYEDYPQIENGVGLVRRLLEEGAKIKRNINAPIRSVITPAAGYKKSLVITGCSAYPYLKKVLYGIGANFDIAPVTNRFFGETVTVAGLLTAGDVIGAIKKISAKKIYREVILPRVMFNHAGYTLDGYSLARIGKSVNLPIRIAETIEEIISRFF